MMCVTINKKNSTRKDGKEDTTMKVSTNDCRSYGITFFFRVTL